MSDSRPLPSNPSLEFERKAAKLLLQQLRAGDSGARARARAHDAGIAKLAPASLKLSHAQLIIAREYGFTSWPRLVRYFAAMERQRASDQVALGGWRPGSRSRAQLESSVQELMRQFSARLDYAVRSIAAYVPRFYGLRLTEVAEHAITEADARLAVARRYGCSNWDDLMRASSDETPVEIRGTWAVDEFTEAWQAVHAGDVTALKRAVQAHPGLLERESPEGRGVQRLLEGTLQFHDRSAPAESSAIVEWLVAQGADIKSIINPYLLGLDGMRPDRVAWLIKLGADPNWIAPNGMSVLDHAILRWWNGEAVDVLASHARPRDAAWIAAGLGNVTALSRWFDARGTLRPEARRDRPDFASAHPRMAMPMIPEPTNEELLAELLVVATMNERAAVIEYLVQRGADVNGRLWHVPLLVTTVANDWPISTEALLRLGADPNLRGTMPKASAREMARAEWMQHPNPKLRRIVELLGLDPDALLAEQNAKPLPDLKFSTRVPEVLALAGDDAHRRGESVVSVENLFFGLMRARTGAREVLRWTRRIDVRRFAQHYHDRLLSHDDRVDAPAIALDAAVEAALADARADAQQRRRDSVTAERILYALVQRDELPIAQLLLGFDVELASLRRELER